MLAFIFSLIRSNSQTVLSTRLNQEMRATMALIANDLRRARGMADPIAAVGTGGAVLNPYSGISIPSADCIRYSYADDIAGATTDYRALRLDAGKVVLVRAATAAGAACNSAGTVLNTDGIVITNLEFVRDTAASDRRIEVELTGQLANPPAFMSENPGAGVSTKTIRQTIAIRSNGT